MGPWIIMKCFDHVINALLLNRRKPFDIILLTTQYDNIVGHCILFEAELGFCLLKGNRLFPAR